jgi:uncharacterized hydrophobic protein (TIGR00341 family)
VPLRLIEAVIPKQKKEEIEKLFNIDGVIDFWREELYENKTIYKILVRTEISEKIIDKLSRKFSKDERFRIVVMDVTATVPIVEEEVEEKSKKKKTIGRLRVSREELYSNISSSANLNYVYISMVVLSTIIAAFGFINNNTAVIIGAMVIAPLLGPNIAISLATVLGDIELEKKAFLTGFVGGFIAFTLAVVLGVIFNINPEIEEIRKRIYVNFGDIVIAIASGIAGVLAFTTGASVSLVGVMVAIALLPPLVASGLLLGSGYLFYSLGSLLLFLANFASLNLAGVLTFTIQGVKPMNWWEEKKAKQYRKKAMILWLILLFLLAIAIYLERIYIRS